jgi:hypothetical protein
MLPRPFIYSVNAFKSLVRAYIASVGAKSNVSLIRGRF